MNNFVLFIVVKAVLDGSTKIFFNFQAAFSMSDFVDDFFFAAYAAFMTQYGFYPWTEMQVNKKRFYKHEDRLTFAMSENYALTRDQFMKKLFQRYGIFLLIIYWDAFWCCWIT